MSNFPDQPLKCSATRAVKSIFNGPNWPSNLLWLTLAVLLQSFVVGQIFIFGYGTMLLQARSGLPDRKSPDIDSDRLGDYFMLGLWPFLVYLVASIVVSVVMVIPILIVVGVLVAIASQLGEAGGIVAAVISMPLIILFTIGFVILLVPITIRAMLCQDFQDSFDFRWCLSFLKLTLPELIISTIMFSVLGIAIYLLGAAMICVGILPALGLLSGAAMHLMAQWYELFLSRGGQPVVPATAAVIDATVV